MPLRTRLTAATACVVAFVLAASAVALVVGLRHALTGSLDAAARQRAFDVAAQAASERLGNPVPSGSTADAVVQVIDREGRVVAWSANAVGSPRLFAFPATRRVRTVEGVAVGDAADSYRVARANVGGHTAYVALPYDDVVDTIRRVRNDLAVGLPLVFAVLVALTWVVVGRALRPVEDLREQAARISASDLSERLVPARADDEVHRLADTLNDLLARLDAATARHREFVADAAHELRSPLTALIAQLDVAAAHPDPATWRTDVTTLLGEARHVAKLVDDLLDLARLDARPALDARDVDLDDVVLAEVAQARARSDVTVDASRVDAARLRGDPALLTRLVRNLLDNAVDHAATRVAVVLSAGDGEVVLDVADDGPGVPEADRERIFERFTRLDPARSAGGAGLGLAIVRDIATAHGGTVGVLDGTPGARFVVRLPRGVPG